MPPQKSSARSAIGGYMRAASQDGGMQTPVWQSFVQQVGSDASTEANRVREEQDRAARERKTLFMQAHRRRCREQREREALEAARADQAEQYARDRERCSRISLSRWAEHARYIWLMRAPKYTLCSANSDD